MSEPLWKGKLSYNEVCAACKRRLGAHYSGARTGSDPSKVLACHGPNDMTSFFTLKEKPMNKHCSMHSHYTPECILCKKQYAAYKADLADKLVSATKPVMNAKPGKPFSISEGEVEYVSVPSDYFEPTDEGTNDGEPLPAPQELSKLSVPELRKMCSQKGITRIDGMPVSNCRRDQLVAALQGKPTPGSSPSDSNMGKGEGQGEAGKEYGPEEGKPQPQPIPPPMVPFADAILKSQEFEDAVRHADVLGDVKADVIAANTQINKSREDIRALNGALAKMQAEGVKGGTTNIIVHSKGELPVPSFENAEIPNSPILKRVIEHLSNREHVALVGPAGSGKSTIVRLACKALEATLYHTPCGGDIREQHLLGRTIPVQGEWTYIPAPFVQAFESEGFSVAMLDEMDGVSDPSVLLPINDVLAGFEKLHLPWRWNAPYAERGKGFLGVAATMNTIGAGATSMYQGRTALDGSTLDRFVGRIIVVPYDAAYEEAYVRGPEGTPVCPHGDEFLGWVRTLRLKVEQNNLRRIVSTRMLQQGVAMLRRDWKLPAVKDALLTGWSPDDRRLCGV